MAELPPLVEALLRPDAYPHPPDHIELIQTQMSFVFLADDYVYKVKKPVNLGYLDYTTLEKRRFYCEKEVELNQRLCSEIYIGVVPITRDKDVIRIEGHGEIIEYAVKMRRLPLKSTLDVLLSEDQVTTEMMQRLAHRIADFHRSAETNADINTFGSLETVIKNTNENFAQTEANVGNTISQAKFQRIKDYTEKFIKENARLFQQRIAGGKIRDCHGDLHSAHICFTDGICIYDCIEFNERFRYGDVASEVAFLAMDLDHYGRADLSRAFVQAYIEESRDKELKKIFSFYKCYRAYVRGKVEGFKLNDPYFGETEKAKIQDTASSYFDLADAYTRSKPMLLITTGLVGTGKTTVAQALAKRLGAVVISSDVIRKRLAGIPLDEHHLEGYDVGIYTAEFSRKTYDKMFASARELLDDNVSVILDASFIKAKERMTARELAGRARADFFITECILSESTIKERLVQRLGQISASDGRWEIYEPQKKQAEPVTEIPSENHVIIDTSLPVNKIIAQALARISR